MPRVFISGDGSGIEQLHKNFKNYKKFKKYYKIGITEFDENAPELKKQH